jgi:TatD DNase family protein
MLIDTHSHIYTGDFSDDREEVIHDALRNGVVKIIMPNIDSKSIPDLMEVTRFFPDVCYPLMGLHPGSVTMNYKQELDLVAEWLWQNGYQNNPFMASEK